MKIFLLMVKVLTLLLQKIQLIFQLFIYISKIQRYNIFIHSQSSDNSIRLRNFLILNSDSDQCCDITPSNTIIEKETSQKEEIKVIEVEIEEEERYEEVKEIEYEKKKTEEIKLEEVKEEEKY